MKKVLTYTLAATLIVSLAGCGSHTAVKERVAGERYITDPAEITVESITEMMKPSRMLEVAGGFKAEYKYSGFGSQDLDDASVYASYLQTDDLIEVCQVAEYADGTYTREYFNNEDSVIYRTSTEAQINGSMEKGDFEKRINSSIQAYEEYDTVLTSVSDRDGVYIAYIEVQDDGAPIYVDQVTLDPETGSPLHIETVFEDNRELSITVDITYGADVDFDRSAKDNQDQSKAPLADKSVAGEEKTDATTVSEADAKKANADGEKATAKKKAKKSSKKATAKKTSTKKTSKKSSKKATAKKTSTKKESKKSSKKATAKKTSKKSSKKATAKKTSKKSSKKNSKKKAN